MGDAPRVKRTLWRLNEILFWSSTSFFATVVLSPLLWMVFSSIRTNPQIVSFPPPIWPLTLENYPKLFRDPVFTLYTKNSLIISILATLWGLAIGLPGAYVIARSQLIRYAPMVLIARMAPTIVLAIPWYMMYGRINLIDTVTGLVIAHLLLTGPMIAWTMIGFFRNIPMELEDAALVDGCNHYQIFLKIILPVVKPGIASSTILAFAFSWSDLILATILGGGRSSTLPVIAMRQFVSQDIGGIDFAGMFAAAVILTLPALLIAFLFGNQILTGMAMSGVEK